jgi:5-oxopent-3-ene-1,2,5-tricarboxylate decarboxylase/2-hydroxyhepta-2,4-diene-1,7-dioate isomerase
MSEFRRILLHDLPTQTHREGDELVTTSDERVAIEDAVHLPPTEPSKIIATHLTYRSRVDEFMTKLPPAPTYFHKPTTSLNAHLGDVVRPARCKFLNF